MILLYNELKIKIEIIKCVETRYFLYRLKQEKVMLGNIEIKQDTDSDNTDHTPLKKMDNIEVKKADEYATSESFMEFANVQKIKKSVSKRDSVAREPILINDTHSSIASRRSGSTSIQSKRVKRNEKVDEPLPEQENKNIKIREKKLDYIRKIERLCHLNKRKMKIDPINYTLEEIENEFKKESREYKNKQGAELYKGLLKMTTTGLEMANTQFNPYSETVDLVGWSDSVKNDIDAEQYDEVLYQLYEKYGAAVEWGPEWKLGFMLTQSAVIYATTKHISQNPNMMQSMLNRFMGIPRQSDVKQHNQENVRLNLVQDDSETSDDVLPSKIKEMEPPNYADILEKMKQQDLKKENEKALVQQQRSHDTVASDLKKENEQSVSLKDVPTRKIGRPRKQKIEELDDSVEKVVNKRGRPRKQLTHMTM
jgi:hypothetical protein